MVELRQRAAPPLKRKSPSPDLDPDSQKNSDVSSLMLRRSGRKPAVDSDETKNDQRIKATVEDGVLVISGLIPEEAFPRRAAAGDDSEDTTNDTTWESKWLDSPTKRRRLDRDVNGNSQSPVTNSRGRGSSLREITGRSTRKNAGQQLGARSDDEVPRTRRSRLSDSILSVLKRSRTNASHANQSKETSQSATPIKSMEDSAEAGEHVSRAAKRRKLQGQQEPAENHSSGHSTPAEAPSPALSSSPSPGPPAANDLAGVKAAVSKDPDDLDMQDLPPAFLPMPPPSSPSIFSEKAEYLKSQLYQPISQPNQFIQMLNGHPPSSRSTETLWALASHTQEVLKAWQDEYILLDKITAPVSQPIPKKPATGGRIPAEPAAFEAEKQKELYNESSLLAAAMGIVINSSGTRTRRTSATSTTAHGNGNGARRELRQRKAETSLVDGLGISSDDAGGRGGTKRTRRPARRFEIGQNALEGSEADMVPATRGVGTRRRGRLQPTNGHEQVGWSGVHKRGRVGALLGQESAGISSTSATPETEDDGGKGSSRHDLYHPSVGPRGGRGAAARRRGRGNSQATIAEPTPASTSTGPRRQKAKSEKRSESMTLWWAARKKKAAEEKIRQMRERGEIHGPSEGIMDTTQPIVTKSSQSGNTASYMPASTSKYRYTNPPAPTPPAPAAPNSYLWHQHTHHNSFIAPPRTGPPPSFPQYHSALDQGPYGSRGGMSPGSPPTTGPNYTNSISSILNNAPPPPSQQRMHDQRQHDDGSGRHPASMHSPGAYGAPQYSPGGYAGGGHMGQPPPHLLHHPPPPPSFLQMQQPPPPHNQQQDDSFSVAWGARYPRY